MVYTNAELTQVFWTLTDGASPDASASASLAFAAAANAAGDISDVQALQLAANTAQLRAATDVIFITQGFYAGALPNQAAIDALINDPAQGFGASAGGQTLENRLYDAALKLVGAPGSAGYAAFTAKYGALSLEDTVTAAGLEILGSAAAPGFNNKYPLSAIVEQIPALQAVAAARAAPGADLDLAAKAVITAYVLAQSLRTDTGVFAQALDSYHASLAPNGAASLNVLAAFAPGDAFQPAFAPFADGQVYAAGGPSLISLGVAAGAVANVSVGAGATVTVTGDLAVNTGQFAVSVAGGAPTGGDVLNFNVVGQSRAGALTVSAPNVEVVNLHGTAAAPNAVLSLSLTDAALVTLNIAGGQAVSYAAPSYKTDAGATGGALRLVDASHASASVVIDLTGTGDVANDSATGGVRVLGSAAADTFLVRNYASVTGGGGADLVVVAAPVSVSAISAVTDAHAGLVVAFAGVAGASFAAGPLQAGSVRAGLDAAAAAGPGVVSWFQSGGDTYVVADHSDAATYQAGSDVVLRLVGLHDLSSSNLNAQGALVLGG